MGIPLLIYHMKGLGLTDAALDWGKEVHAAVYNVYTLLMGMEKIKSQTLWHVQNLFINKKKDKNSMSYVSYFLFQLKFLR